MKKLLNNIKNGLKKLSIELTNIILYVMIALFNLSVTIISLPFSIMYSIVYETLKPIYKLGFIKGIIPSIIIYTASIKMLTLAVLAIL